MPTFDITVQGKDYTVDAPSEEALPEIVDQIAKDNPQETSASELAGAAIRGLGPVGIGAGAGALIAGPVGARVGAGLVEFGGLAADLAAIGINKALGTRYTIPSEAIQKWMTEAGVPEAKSDKAKIVEQSARAIASVLGGMGVGGLMEGSAKPLVAKIGGFLTEAPKAQLVGGAAAGAVGEYARQEAEDMGASPGWQAAASLAGGILGGVAGSRLAGIKAGAGVAANEVLQAGEKWGVDITTSMLNQPKGLVGKYMQTFGTNVPVFGTIARNEKIALERSNAPYKLLESYGIDYGSSPDAKAAVMESLTKSRGERLNTLVGQKQSIIDPLAKTGIEVPVPKTLAAIDKEVARLSAINPDAYAPVIDELNSFAANIAGKTLENVEGNRAVLNNMFKNPELASIRGEGEKATERVYKTLRQDMGDFIEGQAGVAKRSAWQSADAELAGMVKEIDRTSLKSVLRTGAATPEVVAKMLFSKKDSELNLLLANLDAEGKATAKAAVLQEAANRAIDKRTGLISPDKFDTKLVELKKQTDKLFAPSEREMLKGFGELMKTTRFAGLFAPDAPTGIKGVVPQSALLIGANVIGLFKVAATGALWRAYESKMVRNLLERIATNPPEKMELIKRASTALQIAFFRQMGNEMIQKDIPITFSPDSVKTEQVGEGSVSTDMSHGYRAVSKDGKKHRLYGPGNELIGVFPSLNDARLYADQQVVNKIRIPKY